MRIIYALFFVCNYRTWPAEFERSEPQNIVLQKLFLTLRIQENGGEMRREFVLQLLLFCRGHADCTATDLGGSCRNVA